MQVAAELLIAFISAMLALLALILRLFVTGALHPRETVPREDYERVITINEGYAAKFGEQTESIRTLAGTVEKLVDRVGPGSPPVRRRRADAGK
jgi:hypothetical protein